MLVTFGPGAGTPAPACWRAVQRIELDTLAADECLRLLATHWLGRVGLSVGALPAILPVTYLVDGASVVFRTASGSKLDAIGSGDVICFEADQADRAAQAGWSVLVVGRAREVTASQERARLERLHFERWPSPLADHYVRLPAERISGRRILQPSTLGPGG